MVSIIDKKQVLHLYTYSTGKTVRKREGVKFAFPCISYGDGLKNDLYTLRNDGSLWLNDVLFMKDVRQVKENCALKNDGSLWIWGFNNHIHTYENMTKGYDKPQMIMNSVKYIDSFSLTIAIIKDNGSICIFGQQCPDMRISVPRKVMEKVSKFSDSGIITMDGEFYSDNLNSYYLNDPWDYFTKVSDDCKEFLPNDFIEKKDGTLHKVEYLFDANVKKLKYIGKSSEYKLIDGYMISNDGTIFDYDMKEIAKIPGAVKVLSYNLVLDEENKLWKINGTEGSGKASADVILKDVKEVTDLYISGAEGELILDKSGSLWFLSFDYSLQENNNVSGKLSKVYNDIAHIIVKDNRGRNEIFIEKNDKSVCHANLNSDIYGDNSNFDISRVFEKVCDNVDDTIDYGSSWVLKRDGSLWIKGYSHSLEPDSRYEVFDKVMDNVKIFNGSGLAIDNNDNLWAFGTFYKSNPVPEDLKPRKIMSDVKRMDEINGSECIAIKKDNSLWVFNATLDEGSNIFRYKGMKPQKVMDNVSDYEFNFYKYSVTGMTITSPDGSLYRVGNFGYWKSPLNVNNPMDITADTVCPYIKHFRFCAVGIDEYTDVLVNITDSQYNSNVKVVMDDKTEIVMEKCSEGYYVAKIPARHKIDSFGYKISAEDTNGNRIETEIFSLQSVANDILFSPEGTGVIKPSLKIRINGNNFEPADKPLLKDGRVLVPARALSDALDAKTVWDAVKCQVTIVRGDLEINADLKTNKLKVNGKEYITDVPPMLVNSRLYVPLRVFSESFGIRVEYNPSERIVTLEQ
jgi:hypothetical protein